VKYTDEFVCCFCIDLHQKALLKAASKKFKSKLPIESLRQLAQTTWEWKPWDTTGNTPLYAGYPPLEKIRKIEAQNSSRARFLEAISDGNQLQNEAFVKRAQADELNETFAGNGIGQTLSSAEDG